MIEERACEAGANESLRGKISLAGWALGSAGSFVCWCILGKAYQAWVHL
jgi:hypothetical protein